MILYPLVNILLKIRTLPEMQTISQLLICGWYPISRGTLIEKKKKH